jgi:hypothetical protein
MVLEFLTLALSKDLGTLIISIILGGGFILGIVYTHKNFATKSWVSATYISKEELDENNKQASENLVSKKEFDGGMTLIASQINAMQKQLEKLEKILMDYIILDKNKGT